MITLLRRRIAAGGRHCLDVAFDAAEVARLGALPR